jgi:hypothetical protein
MVDVLAIGEVLVDFILWHYDCLTNGFGISGWLKTGLTITFSTCKRLAH